MLRQWIFLTVLLSLTSFSLKLNAESPDHAESVDTASKQRQEADLKLSQQSVNFISSHFWVPSNIVEEKYGKKIPDAMEKALKGDESEISPIVSKLMGTINGKQAEKLVVDAFQMRKEELKKAADSEKGTDKRFVGFLDRFIWAALKNDVKLGSVDEKTQNEIKDLGKNDEAQAFNKDFEKEFAKIKDQNETTLEKIKQASEGNAEAVKWIKENLNQNSLLRWAEGQKKSGNSESAEKLVNALSLKVGNQKVLDMWNGNESQRLFLGNTKESVSKALDGLFNNSNSKGFGSAMVAYNAHPTPAKQWFIDDAGNFKVGAPSGFVAPQAEVAKTPAKASPTSTGSTPVGGGTSQTPVTNENFNRFMSIVKAKDCTSCHGSGAGASGSSFSSLKIHKNGEDRPLSSFISHLASSMKSVFSNSEIAELERVTQGVR